MLLLIMVPDIHAHEYLMAVEDISDW